VALQVVLKIELRESLVYDNLKGPSEEKMNSIKIMNICIFIFMISCAGENDILTDVDIAEIKRYDNLMRSSISGSQTKEDSIFVPYIISELNIKISIPDDAYVILRNGFYNGGPDHTVDLPEPFEILQGKLVEKKVYLLAWNKDFRCEIIKAENEDTEIGERTTDFFSGQLTDYLSTLLGRDVEYKKNEMRQGYTYFLFSDAKESDIYYIIANGNEIIIDIKKNTDMAKDVSEKIIGTIFFLNDSSDFEI
jgi:hypothetical protein